MTFLIGISCLKFIREYSLYRYYMTLSLWSKFFRCPWFSSSDLWSLFCEVMMPLVISFKKSWFRWTIWFDFKFWDAIIFRFLMALFDVLIDESWILFVRFWDLVYSGAWPTWLRFKRIFWELIWRDPSLISDLTRLRENCILLLISWFLTIFFSRFIRIFSVFTGNIC